eukprot:PhM_4_TR739/c0_g1_i1/m.100034
MKANSHSLYFSSLSSYLILETFSFFLNSLSSLHTGSKNSFNFLCAELFLFHQLFGKLNEELAALFEHRADSVVRTLKGLLSHMLGFNLRLLAVLNKGTALANLVLAMRQTTRLATECKRQNGRQAHLRRAL